MNLKKKEMLSNLHPIFFNCIEICLNCLEIFTVLKEVYTKCRNRMIILKFLLFILYLYNILN